MLSCGLKVLIKCTYIRAADLLWSLCPGWWAYCACILLSAMWCFTISHFRTEMTAGEQEMKFSCRSLRPCWPRMHCCVKTRSRDIVSADLCQQGYWLELTVAVPLLQCQQPFGRTRLPHANIILQNICSQISERFCFKEPELNICVKIFTNVCEGEQSITPLQSFGWSHVFALRGFLIPQRWEFTENWIWKPSSAQTAGCEEIELWMAEFLLLLMCVFWQPIDTSIPWYGETVLYYSGILWCCKAKLL